MFLGSSAQTAVAGNQWLVGKKGVQTKKKEDKEQSVIPTSCER